MFNHSSPTTLLTKNCFLRKLNPTSGKCKPHNFNKRHDFGKEDINPAASFQNCKTCLEEMSPDPEPNTRRQAGEHQMDRCYAKWIWKPYQENHMWNSFFIRATKTYSSTDMDFGRNCERTEDFQQSKARLFNRGFQQVCGVDIATMFALLVA